MVTCFERGDDVIKSAKKIKYKQEKAIIQKMYFSLVAIKINEFLYKYFKSFFKIGD